MTDAPAIALEGVAFAYDGVPVLENVTAEIEDRDYVGIVGPNGGGKTTLLKLMVGLLRPKRGTVRVFGGPPARARRSVGYVPQEFSYDPRFPVTVRDVVLMGRLGRAPILGPYRRADRLAEEEALEEVGLGGFGPRPFEALSGGERQRVLIARALSAGPRILLLDEPTTSVDAVAERGLHDLLKRLNDSVTVVVVTHDLAFVSTHVTRVLCVNRRVRDHPTCDVDSLTAEMLREVFGGEMRMVRHDAGCPDGPKSNGLQQG